VARSVTGWQPKLHAHQRRTAPLSHTTATTVSDRLNSAAEKKCAEAASAGSRQNDPRVRRSSMLESEPQNSCLVFAQRRDCYFYSLNLARPHGTRQAEFSADHTRHNIHRFHMAEAPSKPQRLAVANRR